LTGSNTYTGPTILSGGAVLGVTNLANGSTVSSIGASSSGSANLVFNGGTLLYTGGNASFTQITQTPSVSTDRLFTLAGNGSIDSSGNYGNSASFAVNQNNAALVFSNTGSVAYAGSGVRTLTLTGNSTGDNELKLALGDNSGSALSVNKAGAGLWLLSGSNTYTGATSIVGGMLQAQDGIGLPTNSNLSITASGVFQSSGTFTRTVGTGAGQIQILGGGGGFAASSSKLTVNLLGSATLGTAPMANSTLILNSTTALADVELASPLSLGTTTGRTIQVDDNGLTSFDFATISGTLSGAIGASTIALTKTGVGNLILSGANTYTGSTQVSAGALIVRSIGTLNATSSNLGSNSTNAGSLLLGNAAAAGQLFYVGPGEVTTRTLALAGTTGGATIDASGSGPLQLSTVSNSGAGIKTLTLRGLSTDMNLPKLATSTFG
jgi:autotransporter-associated beta strand protein